MNIGVFVSVLTVLFIGLKLMGYIDWSWVWVLGPLWIPFTVAVVGIFLYSFAKGFRKAWKDVYKK